MRRGSAASLLLAVVVGGVLLGGCSVPEERTDAVTATAERFARRAAAHDMAAACALLAPTVREELADDPGPTCADGLTDADLPFAGAVRSTAVYGRHAQVVLDGDTYFLASSGEGWRITGAGCTPRTDRPYACDVKGD
ncbi:hypothetical protein [Streptomyces sp. NPDC053755]|uniref:hypothetical protein n=1 Tax=Streptomyces sp. NPDC053755 TaxID=3155815 RepID=UPI00342763BF